MNLTPVAVAAALVGAGISVAMAPVAGAVDTTALGTYTFEAEDGESATWTLTPCAEPSDRCVHVASTGNTKRAPWSSNAYWTVGSWILFVEQPDAILCPDGASAPGNNNYSWDSVSLTGKASIFSNGACGAEPESIASPFALTKTGSGPVQYPTAPVQIEPYVVDIPEPYVPGAAEAPPVSAPAPVETDPALKATPEVIPNTSDPLTEADVAQPGFNR